jgi:hypothetical protein
MSRWIPLVLVGACCPPGAREEGHRLDRAAAVREARASGARRRWRGAPQEPSKLGVFASIVYEFAVISRFIAEQKLKQLQEERFRRYPAP